MYIEKEREMPLKVYNEQDHPYSMYLYGKIHQNTKGVILICIGSTRESLSSRLAIK